MPPQTDVALPRGVRVGYGVGSVATGAFGTVPGLMLLPYLTDTLGVAAVLAGVIVFAPKAWDVVLNPIAGRISDRHEDPRGPRRPFLLRGGLALAVCFALLFAGPALGSTALDAVWVLVLFLACATAYAFFQVPFVAMPAEMTDDYAERTRLMTWRVALLALTILLTGATAPAVRDAIGGRDGYRAMGLLVAVVIVLGVVGSYVGTRAAPLGQVHATSGSLRDQLRIVAAARDFRLLLTTFVIQALAVGAMLAGVDYVSRVVLGSSGASTVLFVCFVGPALLLTPVWARVGERVGKKAGYVASSLFLAVGALLLVSMQVVPSAVVYLATALVGVGYAGAQVFPMAMLPGRRRRRRAPHRGQPGRGLHRRVDRGGDARPRARTGRVRAGAGARGLRVVDRRRRRPAATPRSPRSRSGSRCCPRCSCCCRWCGSAATGWVPTRCARRPPRGGAGRDRVA